MSFDCLANRVPLSPARQPHTAWVNLQHTRKTMVQQDNSARTGELSVAFEDLSDKVFWRCHRLEDTAAVITLQTLDVNPCKLAG